MTCPRTFRMPLEADLIACSQAENGFDPLDACHMPGVLAPIESCGNSVPLPNYLPSCEIIENLSHPGNSSWRVSYTGGGGESDTALRPARVVRGRSGGHPGYDF